MMRREEGAQSVYRALPIAAFQRSEGLLHQQELRHECESAIGIAPVKHGFAHLIESHVDESRCV